MYKNQLFTKIHVSFQKYNTLKLVWKGGLWCVNHKIYTKMCRNYMQKYDKNNSRLIFLISMLWNEKYYNL